MHAVYAYIDAGDGRINNNNVHGAMNRQYFMMQRENFDLSFNLLIVFGSLFCEALDKFKITLFLPAFTAGTNLVWKFFRNCFAQKTDFFLSDFINGSVIHRNTHKENMIFAEFVYRFSTSTTHRCDR